MLPKTFADWIDRWTDLHARGLHAGDFAPNASQQEHASHRLPFKCYNPVDMQSQRLTCDLPLKYPQHVNATLALRNLQFAAFVGLVEAYPESTCVLKAKITGSVPANCNCKSEQWNQFKQHHESHGVKYHSVDNEHESVLKKVDDLTVVDRKVFVAAIDRFMHDALDVEKQHGVKILCDEKMNELHALRRPG